MQINTSTLMGMLGTNLQSNVKQKIQDASSNGKTDLSAIVKDKTIQTLLSDTFKTLTQGTGDKGNILQTLQNSKHMFDIKSFSNDIKNISTALAGSENPKLQQQSVILKDFFINIKNIDENVLKTNFSNSGIMLESKLNNLASILKEPLLGNKMQLQKLLQDLEVSIKSIMQNGTGTLNVMQIKDSINSLNTLLKRFPDLQTSIKTALSNLLNNINSLSLSQTLQPNPAQLETLLSSLKTIEKNLSSDIGKTFQLTQVQKFVNEVSKDIKSIISNGLNQNSMENLKTSTGKLESFLQNIDLKPQLKTSLGNILNNFQSLFKTPASLNQPQTLNSLLNSLQNVSQQVQESFNDPFKQQLSVKLSDIGSFAKNPQVSNTIQLQKNLENINTLLKNLTQNNFSVSSEQIKTGISNINSLTLPIQQKVNVGNVLSKINTLLQNSSGIVLPQQQNSLNNITSMVQNLQSDLSKNLEQNISSSQKDMLAFFKDSKVMNTIELQKGLETLGQNLNAIMNSGISELQAQTMQNTISTISSSLTKGDILQLEVKNAVNNLLQTAGKIAQNPRTQPQLQVLGSLTANLNTTLSNISNMSLQLPSLGTQTQPPNITNDIKGALLQVLNQLDKDDGNSSKELKAIVEKTLTQVEYFQALSYSSSSNHTYLPFSWENIEEGDIKFANNGKDDFSCQINLQMKEYGQIRILLELEKKNYLNINIGVENKEFKTMVQEKLQLLRKNINTINLNLQGINIFDLNNSDVSQKINGYNSGSTLDFGLDIKV